MSSTLKQIACVGAYAAGFAVGTYGAYKAVNAIERRFPMENSPLTVGFESIGVRFRVKKNEATDHAIAALTSADGGREIIEGTIAEVDSQLRARGLSSHAV
jgi:hypothetical protein